MTFLACLAKLQDEGVIDRERAARFTQLFTEMEAGFKRRFGDTPGSVLAGEETLKALEWDMQLKRRQAALQIDAQMRGLSDMQTYAKGDATKLGKAVKGMMARYLDVPLTSVESRSQMLELGAQSRIADFIEKHRRNLLGEVRDKAGLMDVVRARHGEKVANPQAQAFSDAIGDVFEDFRQRFNALGGDIGFDAKYGLPRKWDAARVRAVPFEEFRNAIAPELDTARMVDPRTGQAFTEDGLNDALRAVYETIRTDGMSGIGASQPGGARMLANRRSDPRFLQFRDADAWLRVNDRFGAADPFTAIMDHIQGMAQDIAMMERFGPNPNSTVQFLVDQMQRGVRQSDDPSAHALNISKTDAAAIDKLWKEVSGQAGIPMLGGPVRSAVVRGLHGARDITTAAKLGKAAISAFWGDMGQIKTLKYFNGLPQTSDMLGYMREFKPQSAADRKLAAELELGLQDAAHAMIGLNRYFGKTQSPAMTKVIADSALRVTGLNKVTEAGQLHFSKTFLWALARERDKAFDAVNPWMRDSMMRYGIDAADWDAMRSAPIVKGEGWDSREFMAAKNVRAISESAANKMMDMVLSERAAAVIESSARARAALNFGNPGTWQGEAGRSLFQFKTFTASMMMVQGERILARPETKLAFGAMYAARVLVTLTLFGAAIVQSRQIVNGRDLRPMKDWEFWADAMVAGGGLAIVGDVLGTFKNGDMAGLGGIVSGPLVGALGDVGKATAGNAFRALKAYTRNKPIRTHFGRDALELIRKNTPGSSTWYAGIAFQRMVIDQLRTMADPDYPQSFRRATRAASEQGAPFWWKPGAMLPDRAPDPNTALQNRPDQGGAQ